MNHNLKILEVKTLGLCNQLLEETDFLLKQMADDLNHLVDNYAEKLDTQKVKNVINHALLANATTFTELPEFILSYFKTGAISPNDNVYHFLNYYSVEITRHFNREIYNLLFRKLNIFTAELQFEYSILPQDNSQLPIFRQLKEELTTKASKDVEHYIQKLKTFVQKEITSLIEECLAYYTNYEKIQNQLHKLLDNLSSLENPFQDNLPLFIDDIMNDTLKSCQTDEEFRLYLDALKSLHEYCQTNHLTNIDYAKYVINFIKKYTLSQDCYQSLNTQVDALFEQLIDINNNPNYALSALRTQVSQISMAMTNPTQAFVSLEDEKTFTRFLTMKLINHCHTEEDYKMLMAQCQTCYDELISITPKNVALAELKATIDTIKEIYPIKFGEAIDIESSQIDDTSSLDSAPNKQKIYYLPKTTI